MTVLSQPRHPLIDQALTDARRWCAGRVIDERPALVHAVLVAVTIGAHVRHPAPELVCAALLHDAPEFTPPDVDLNDIFTARYGPEVPRIIGAMQAEHHALDEPDPPIVVEDLPVLLASTADKIVALASLLRRARASGDVDAFFAARPALLQLLPHFRAFHTTAAGRVPASMSDALHTVLTMVARATAGARSGTR